MASWVEQLVFRFTRLRLHPDTIDDDRRALADLDDTGRRLQLLAVVPAAGLARSRVGLSDAPKG